MVKKEISVILFTGTDSGSKDIKLRELKRQFFNQDLEQFNFDVFYGKELSLNNLQEKLLSFPVNAKKRIVVIRLAQQLKPEIKNFVLDFAKKDSATILVLDFENVPPRDEFFKKISRYSKLVPFKEAEQLNTFILSRQIELKRMDQALKILNQLLEKGEKPERILGALRYVWERSPGRGMETRKKLKLLLNCDLDIKKSRMKPVFALEKLVVSLCSLR